MLCLTVRCVNLDLHLTRQGFHAGGARDDAARSAAACACGDLADAIEAGRRAACASSSSRACAAGRCPWPAGRSRNRRRPSARRPACPAIGSASSSVPPGGSARAHGAQDAPAPRRRRGRGCTRTSVTMSAPARQRVGEEVCRRRPCARSARPGRGEARRARARPPPAGRTASAAASARAAPRAARKLPSPPPTSSRQRCRRSG